MHKPLDCIVIVKISGDKKIMKAQMKNTRKDKVYNYDIVI